MKLGAVGAVTVGATVKMGAVGRSRAEWEIFKKWSVLNGNGMERVEFLVAA